ncbi:NAD(P)-dependent alcohol dehydrogenase [Orbus sturtevantii]|uniref:NAD(P)-dependent alcohol dehydrogenase n=1 Tax=Orbus sturtevantii TaxID=3074109 RepID=UPI00370DA97F
MKKIIFNKCGNAEVLTIGTVPTIDINGNNQAIIKIYYSSLNAIDWKYRQGYFRFFTKLLKSDLGYDVIGKVVKLSSNVTKFQVGDIVLGLLPTLVGGAHSEYARLTTDQFIKISSENNLKQLAGLPMAGVTAWIALFEKAKLQKGQKILINGGGSGVGHLSIQLAKSCGAEVTSVSSQKNEDFCKEMGADFTINYQNQDVLSLNKKFDVIFDIVSNLSIKQVKPLLNENGVYVATNISLSLLKGMLFNPKTVKFVYVHPHTKALVNLYTLTKQGKLNVHVDKVFKIDDIIAAHQYMEQSRTVGKVILQIAADDN